MVIYFFCSFNHSQKRYNYSNYQHMKHMLNNAHSAMNIAMNPKIYYFFNRLKRNRKQTRMKKSWSQLIYLSLTFWFVSKNLISENLITIMKTALKGLEKCYFTYFLSNSFLIVSLSLGSNDLKFVSMSAVYSSSHSSSWRCLIKQPTWCHRSIGPMYAFSGSISLCEIRISSCN